MLNKIRNQNNISAYRNEFINNIDIKNNLHIGVVELHLTNLCDLKCNYCTFAASNDSQAVFMKNELWTIVELKPSNIILSGGGEPTLYKNQGWDIYDVISFFKKELPNTNIGLITNGRDLQYYSSDLTRLEWLRVSLDYLDEIMFEKVKGGYYKERLKTIEKYLNLDIKNVGIGMLVNTENVGDILKNTRFIYEFFKEKCTEIGKLNVQFRKMCGIQSCNCKSKNYEAKIRTKDDGEEWRCKIESLKIELENISNENREMYDFIVTNTNILSLFTDKIMSSTSNLSNFCYLSLLKWIVKADGEVHSCTLTASNSEKSLGNLYNDDIKEIHKNAIKAFHKNKNFCYRSFCCGINSNALNKIFEKSLHEEKNSCDRGFF